MVAGIGTDIIEKERVLKAIENKSFLDKYFTDGERQLIKAAYVFFHNGEKERAECLGLSNIHISLSDTKDTAIAYVVLEY